MLVTHDQAEALSMGREVAVLREGRLVQRAEPAALYRAPIDIEVARFVGEAVVLDGECNGRRVKCALGDLDVLDANLDGPVQVMIRPEQIRLTRRVHGDQLDGRGVIASVIDHSYYGPDTVVALALDTPGAPVIKARTFDPDVPGAGEAVHVLVAGPVVTYPPQPAGGSTRDIERTGP